jgi:cobalt/nickel transport system permease protein
MDIAVIDYWATGRTSYLHRASAPAKLLAAGLTLAAVIISNDPFVLLAIYLTAAAAIAATGLPAWRIVGLAAYPVVFALLFALSRWDGSLYTPAVIIFKALAAALAVVSVIVTTPYPQVFSVLRTLLPSIVADGLFLTYRALFILLGLLDDLLIALRLRGGLSRRRYIQNMRNLSMGLGLLLVRALALAERLYDVMRVRGYAGRLASADGWRRFRPPDLVPLGGSAVLLATALALRLVPALQQFNGYVLLAALVLLASSLLARQRSSRPVGREVR